MPSSDLEHERLGFTLGMSLARASDMSPTKSPLTTKASSSRPAHARESSSGAFSNKRNGLLCREIMRRPVISLVESDTLLAAARIMRDMDLGFLPVCATGGVVAGVLTDRDLTTRGCAEDLNMAKTAVASVMTRGAIACAPDDRVATAEALMRLHRVTRILILDREQRPCGVLSLSDIAQYGRPSKVGRTLQTVAERKYAPERP